MTAPCQRRMHLPFRRQLALRPMVAYTLAIFFQAPAQRPAAPSLTPFFQLLSNPKFEESLHRNALRSR